MLAANVGRETGLGRRSRPAGGVRNMEEFRQDAVHTVEDIRTSQTSPAIHALRRMVCAPMSTCLLLPGELRFAEPGLGHPGWVRPEHIDVAGGSRLAGGGIQQAQPSEPSASIESNSGRWRPVSGGRRG
jgi:hypothetical protein